MFYFNRREVYLGYSMDELSKVRDCLNTESIKHDYKIINHSGQGNGNGSIGMNRKYEKQYYVYVKKVDYENAQYLVDNLLHKLRNSK